MYSRRHEHRKTGEEIDGLKIETINNKMIGTDGSFRSFAYLGNNTTKEDAKRAIQMDYKEYVKESNATLPS